MVIAYSKSDNVSIREELTHYAKSKKINIDAFIQEKDLKEQINPQDILFVKNVYELGENPQTILHFIKYCSVNDVIIYSVDDDHCFNAKVSKELNILINLFVELCEYRSNKAKESLRIMKENGVKLGRTEGSTVKLNKMKRRKEAIIKDLQRGYSLNHIYEKYKVSRTTINKLRKIEPRIDEVLLKREN